MLVPAIAANDTEQRQGEAVHGEHLSILCAGTHVWFKVTRRRSVCQPASWPRRVPALDTATRSTLCSFTVPG